MNGVRFRHLVETGIAPFMSELGLGRVELAISGRAYTCEFIGPSHVVTISFEPGDSFLVVAVQSLKNGILSEWDDRASTPRLSDLNHMYMPYVTNQERAENDVDLMSVLPQDDEERMLLKYAKELRLVLPKYFADSKKGH